MPNCRTCRWWTYRTGILAGARTEWPICFQESGYFPDNGRFCTLYEREPGSDDE